MADITTDVQIGGAVVFQDSGRSQAFTGTVAALRDNFHIDITLTSGTSLRNVPHMQLGRYVGWHSGDPSETVALTLPAVATPAYRATKKQKGG